MRIPFFATDTHILLAHAPDAQAHKWSNTLTRRKEKHNSNNNQQVLSSSELTESLSSSLSVCILCLPASVVRCSSINFMLSDRPLLHSTWLTDPRLCQWKIWLPGELDRLFEARRGTTWWNKNVVDDNASFPWHLVDRYTNLGPGEW